MDNNIYNPEYVQTLFDKMSQSYERMNYITSFGFSIRWRHQFLNKIKGAQKIDHFQKKKHIYKNISLTNKKK